MKKNKAKSALGAFMEEANNKIEVKKPGQKTQKPGHKTNRHHHDDLAEKKAHVKSGELSRNSQYRTNFKKED